MSTTKNDYPPPVDKLLTYGKSDLGPKNWPDYRELGLGPEHIPDLIRMATDEELNLADSETPEVWAPVYAWHALGQMRAEAAIEPLLSLFQTLKEDEWVTEELPEVFGMIGPAALPALDKFIGDISHDEFPRIDAIASMQKIGEHWPDARDESVALLMRHLEHFSENEPDVNAFLILGLVKLQAREAAPLIEQAFAADSVEPFIMGDWDDVQVELGLKSPEEVAQKRASRLAEAPSRPKLEEIPAQTSSKTHDKAARKKAKNKMAKQSRKKNRKR